MQTIGDGGGDSDGDDDSKISMNSILLQYHCARLLYLIIIYRFAYIQASLAIEGLVASIVALYICYGECPEQVGQTYPIIFHRLVRTTELRMMKNQGL